MKKFLVLCLVLIMVFSFTACTSNTEETVTVEEAAEEVVEVAETVEEVVPTIEEVVVEFE